MEISDLGSAGADRVEQLTRLSQAQAVANHGTAMLDQVLEVQQQLAAQLLQTMGIGTRLDLFA